jgi:hypothetical protein
MAVERSMQRKASASHPIIRNTRELARYAMDIGGIFLKAVWAGLSEPDPSQGNRRGTVHF